MSSSTLGAAIMRFIAFLLVLALGSITVSVSAAQGDRIQGKPVIDRLDLDALEPGKIHHLYFESVEMGSGQHWYVPVMVAKGARPGKRILLVAGVHGDELTPVATVHEVFRKLDPGMLSGSVIAIVGVNRPGIEYITRNWPMKNLGTSWVNPNRVFPGKADGNTVERQTWLVMERLVKGNVDIAIDMHTGGNGADFALFIFAYSADPESLALADLFPVDQIKLDPGLEGTMEYALVKAGIPALTLELGGPRGFEPDMVRAGVEGIDNVLAHYGVSAQEVGRTAESVNAFRGNALVDVFADTGGFVEYLVELNDTVEEGQRLAIQRDAFGEVVREYKAPASGRVAIRGTDAIRERGSDIVTILTNSPDCAPEGCPYYGGDER
jgi:predicted deacylase